MCVCVCVCVCVGLFFPNLPGFELLADFDGGFSFTGFPISTLHTLTDSPTQPHKLTVLTHVLQTRRVYVTSLSSRRARGKLAGVTNDKESVLL